MANHALEPSFACYVRLGGDLAGLSVASLLARRTPNLVRKHSLRSWLANARSPGHSFVGFSSPTNAAQRGVLQISATFSACQLFRANTERRSGGNNISVLIMKARQEF